MPIRMNFVLACHYDCLWYHICTVIVNDLHQSFFSCFLLYFGVFCLKSRLWPFLVLVLLAWSAVAEFSFELYGLLQSHISLFWGIITAFWRNVIFWKLIMAKHYYIMTLICTLDLLFLSLFNQVINDRLYEACNVHRETKIIYIYNS